jgi:hypothetical protein
VRQLFVAPLAFLVPAVREISVFFRVRSSRLVLRAITGCGEIYHHGDLHLALTESLVRLLRSRRDCHHKMRFLIGNGRCPIRRQVRLRNGQAGGVLLHGNRRAFAHLKGLGKRLHHSALPSGRSLKPALETFLR